MITLWRHVEVLKTSALPCFEDRAQEKLCVEERAQYGDAIFLSQKSFSVRHFLKMPGEGCCFASFAKISEGRPGLISLYTLVC